ncbi:dienelactone hydrolase [Peniophora sp. CONT]|nr:dienelactone hydrolase [Peniophora sp. CONT]
MLITKSYRDVPSKLDANGRPIRIFVIEPNVPEYPHAKFPGTTGAISEIYQVTGPVERFAGLIASHGYIVACPSCYHEFQGPEAIPYDTEGTDRGNRFKIEKEVAAYDEDSALAVDLLTSLPNCTGRIASTGMCLGGHLASAAFDPRVLAAFCFFATDIHSSTLGKGKSDDSLARVRAGALTNKAEIMMVFGKQDTHVPRAGRDLIRKELEDANVTFSFLEVQAQHAFIRDEQSKGRWDAALTKNMFGMLLELFERTVGRDMGPRVVSGKEIEHVC